jgi:5-methylcytosine-specific restriction endonuclease McrA
MRKSVIAYIKATLRRTWGRSKQRQSALKSARVSYGKYKCAHCGKIFRRKEIEVDHRVAVGKFVSFDLFIERLFCDSSGLDVVCKGCHKSKSKKDSADRKK